METISKATAEGAQGALERLRDKELTQDGWEIIEGFVEAALSTEDADGFKNALDHLVRAIESEERKTRPAGVSAESAPRKVPFEAAKDGYINEPMISRLTGKIEQAKREPEDPVPDRSN
jgi:hypothetical protein